MNTVFTNILDTLPIVITMITAGAYFSGIYFTMISIFKLKLYSENNRSNIKTPLAIPILYIVASAALMYLPSAINAVNQTVFGNNFPLDYQTDQLQKALYTVLMYSFVSAVGYLSFIRGWFHLVRAQEGVKDHSNGKALVHILGGILAINIQAVAEIMQKSIGY